MSHRLTRCTPRGYFARVRPHGRITFVGFLLLLGAIAGGYWLVMFVPLYIDQFEVQDAVNSAFNSYGVVNDAQLRVELEAKLREAKFTTHKEIDMMGNEVEKPGLLVTETNPMIEIDTVNRTLSVSYQYDRTVHLVPSDKIKVIHFVAKKKGKFPH